MDFRQLVNCRWADEVVANLDDFVRPAHPTLCPIHKQPLTIFCKGWATPARTETAAPSSFLWPYL